MTTSYFARFKTPRRGNRIRRPSRFSQQASLAVARNPFSTRTIHAKIPDGKTHISSGQRIQAVQSVAPTVNATGVTEFLFFPGANNCVTAMMGKTGGAANEVRNFPIGPTHIKVLQNGTQDEASLKVCAWRTVSAGLRMNLINNADANEGWFEASRINICNGSDYRLTDPGDGSGVVTGTANVTNLAGVGTFPTQNLALTPTFISGKLRDLHRYTFTLKTNTDDHPFIKFADGGTNTQAKFIDTSMDAILIRVHGSPTSNFMLHYVSNQELIYDENTALYRASTRSFHDPIVAGAMQQPSTGVAAGSPTPMAISPMATVPRSKRRANRGGTYRRIQRRLTYS